ncbi:MAG: 5-(carboxyamino)imidazole ribonucleotide synthase [Pseudomonadota bacterium]
MANTLPTGSKIGILGGGQLGRMLSVAASRLGFVTYVYDPDPNAPAAHVAAVHVCAGYDDLDALSDFADAVDVVTYEFENIPTAALDRLDALVAVHPGRRALAVSQDRLIEKTFIQSLGLRVARFADVSSPTDFATVQSLLDHGAILKTRRLGYDGKGQSGVNTQEELESAWRSLGEVPCILEERIPFSCEISVIGARDTEGQIICFDPGENEHKYGILHKTTVPTSLPLQLRSDAVLATGSILRALDYIGVIGVEFFVTEGALCINEFAPRVHNSGHWTQDGCVVDQFEQHIRAVTGLPLNDARRVQNVTMVNLIGSDVDKLEDYYRDPRSAIHLYGKSEIRDGRKMGHVNTIMSETS